ncbi:MAG: alpha-amylase family glycosyl hydrolase [Acidimicrobiales bacterium]|nr:alpha-amylase family glycosyl hydrolase [Acidimicrobiales bacterium]
MDSYPQQVGASQLFLELIADHLARLYPNVNSEALAEQCINAVGIDKNTDFKELDPKRWTEADAILLAYGDSFLDGDQAPLNVLRDTLDAYFSDFYSILHVLPFFPSSSDDGFSVIDHTEVDPLLGEWSHIESLSFRLKLMADVVLNHVSSESEWFTQFLLDQEPGNRYIKMIDPDDDLTKVVRPRSRSLERQVDTTTGVKSVWCTFSDDQIDLDFSNPDVFLEILKIVNHLVEAGVKWFRLDAVAFIWKTSGSSCVHLPETHQCVKILKALLHKRQPEAVLVTETNVPHKQNISYFGEGDEADAIYNFSLPPLILHTFIAESVTALSTWTSEISHEVKSGVFLNFIASHDGIGLRPIEGLLNQDEIKVLIDATIKAGGRYESYNTQDGQRPYELNVSIYDLLTSEGSRYGKACYLAAHTLILVFAGVPLLYINSLMCLPNNHDGMEKRGFNRAINRRSLSQTEVLSILDEQNAHSINLFEELKRRVKIRRAQQAFHPQAAQTHVPLGDEVFGLLRTSQDGIQKILCITNICSRLVKLDAENVPISFRGTCIDLLTDAQIDLDNGLQLDPYGTYWLSISIAE